MDLTELFLKANVTAKRRRDPNKVTRSMLTQHSTPLRRNTKLRNRPVGEWYGAKAPGSRYRGYDRIVGIYDESDRNQVTRPMSADLLRAVVFDGGEAASASNANTTHRDDYYSLHNNQPGQNRRGR